MAKKEPFLLSLLPPSKVLEEISNKTCFEMFLKDLKENLPYSSIFLTKVSKKDAPTYYEVIKSPMDLGTMRKKVYSYDTRSFFGDLDLIWSNCLHFNKGSAFFTECAEKMKIKTESLKAFYFEEHLVKWRQFREFTAGGRSRKKVSGCSACSGIIYELDARNQTRHFVAKILKESGFEMAEGEALNVLTDVFIFYTIKRIAGLLEIFQEQAAGK